MRRNAAVLGLVAVAAATVLSMPGTASAKPPPPPPPLRFPVTAEAVLGPSGAVIDVPASTLTVTLGTPSGSSLPYTAELPLPTVRGHIPLLGETALSADVSFVEQAPLTGSLDLVTGRLTSTGEYVLRLSHLGLAGVRYPVGQHCATAQPVVFSVSSPKGKPFNLMSGGTVRGSFRVGPFTHCGTATTLINLLVAGRGNQLTLDVGGLEPAA